MGAFEITPGNVTTAVSIYRKRMKHLKRSRSKFLRQYVGRFYPAVSSSEDPEDRKAAPINLLHTAVQMFVANLVFRDPKVFVDTEVLEYRDWGDKLALATSHALKKLRMRQVFRQIVTDAAFLAGFIKTGIEIRIFL